MKQKDYLNKKEYNRWLKTLKTGIDTILNENKVEYIFTESDDKMFSSRYSIKNVPNIGNFGIAIEPYECAKGMYSRGVHVFSIYCRFETFNDKDNKLPYRDQCFNAYSGKYNFHSDYSEHETLIDVFLYALRLIFDISKN